MEKREREKRIREEEEEEKKGRREVQGEEEIKYKYVRNFGMNLCMELFVWNFGRIVHGFVWILVWRFGIPLFV